MNFKEENTSVNCGLERVCNHLKFSKDGIILAASQNFCTLCGTSIENIKGNNISSSLFTESCQELVPISFDLLDKGETVTKEREILHPDGTVIYLEMTSKRMSDGTYQSYFSDITRHKTKELALQQQIDELTQLNKEKDHFIAALAHDLINPFNAILGFLDIIVTNIHDFDTERIEKYIHIINNSAKNAFSLMQDTLTWGLIKSNGFKFTPKKLVLATICEESAKNYDAQALLKNISIVALIPEELTVFADAQMLNIILHNLISNAIKFTPKGGQIEINAEQVNDEVIVTISDNGIGMTEEVLNRLFDITQKETTLGTENEKGTGMGLILCKEFIEKHNGRIWVESEVGNGSDFKFAIPSYPSPFLVP